MGDDPSSAYHRVPAGAMDRAALPVGELNRSAWAALQWRQRHLPLDRLRRRSHCWALYSLESRVAWQVADRLGLDDDQRCSLARHHLDRVEQLVLGAHPELIDAWSARVHPPTTGFSTGVVGTPSFHRWRRLRRTVARFTVGWGTWFSNRWVGLHDRWFRLVTTANYRGAPPL